MASTAQPCSDGMPSLYPADYGRSIHGRSDPTQPLLTMSPTCQAMIWQNDLATKITQSK